LDAITATTTKPLTQMSNTQENQELQIGQYVGTCELTVTEQVEKILIDFFNIEVEVMQGQRVILPDGRREITFEVRDEQKGKMIQEFILKVISKSHLLTGN
jgi:hypothetical protein